MADGKKEKTEEEIIQWFEKDLLPQLVAEGRLPVPGAKDQDLVIKSIAYEGTEGRGTDHFASLPYFVNLSLADKTDSVRSQEFRLVVKFINQNFAVRQAMDTDTQFYNEMMFYNEVFSVLQNYLKAKPQVSSEFLYDICPVCRYASIDLKAPEYAIVVMDDLRENNFTCAKSKAELDLDHCRLAMEKLGKFHGVFYAHKMEHPEEFQKLTQQFVECRYQDDRYKEEMNGIFHERTSMRAVQYLLSREDSSVPSSYLNMLKEKITSGIYKQMMGFIEPKEPLAVICHGDFCRNNILYKFENGKPIDCKLFDFQTWRYSSPAIDLSFFIYMNTTQELREAHFDALIDSYLDNVTETISNITQRPLNDIKTLHKKESLMQDFGEHSLYGFAIASFFLPMMMFPREDAASFEDEWETKTMEQMTDEAVEQGGEVATIRLVGIIEHMFKNRFYL